MTEEKNLKILVRMPGALSNMIEALPMFALLKEAYPGAHIAALIKTRYKGLFRNLAVDEVIGFNKKPRFAPVLDTGEDVISFIQSQEYDIGILLPHSFSSAYVFYIGMVKRRLGFVRRFGNFMLTDSVEGSRYVDLVKPLGIEVQEWPEPKLYAKREKQNRLHIGISCCFDNELLTKKWYKDITDFIVAEIPYVMISILAKREHAKDIDEIVLGKEDCIVNLAKKLSVVRKIDIINGFDVFISDNKDLLAVAKGVGTPFVNISGQVENEHLLAEDFFTYIRDAILQPLKDRSSMRSLNDFTPITDGIEQREVSSAKRKRVGVVILAGGMGRRLGIKKPKGLLEIGDSCLYDILLKKASGAEKIGILTSPVTFLETKKYCEGKDIDLFHKKVYPTEEGYGVSPEGNGALFDSLVYSEYWEEWKDLDIISVVAVDNPLAEPLDETLLSTGCELAVIGVERDRKEEKLGVLCKRYKDLAVREYFTLGKEGMEGLGYSGCFAAKPAFFQKVADQTLPFYRVEKKDQVFYERLLIDGFSFAESFEVVKKKREDCFYPIKEKRDLLSYNKILELKE